MKIYSTRHGETDYNKDEIVLGTTDIPLNETGLAQAEALAEKIAELNQIDVMIVSPLKRAQQTALKIADRTGIPMITDDRLREWNYGVYEGKSRFTEGFAEGKTEFGVRMGGSGESVLQLGHRVYSILDEVKAKYSDKTVLLVSHGGICRIIETYFHDLTTAEYSNWFMGNCQLIEYDTEG